MRHRLSGIIFLLVAVSFQWVTAAELNVPGSFTTIQAAIDAAADGDTVIVATGTYTENLALKSGVDVRGAEAARTFIEPAISADPVVLANSVDNVLLVNFTIINAQIGIDVNSSTNLRLANSVLDSAGLIALRVDSDSQVDVLNVVFWNNEVAIQRATVDAQITNNGFIGNTVTITSPIATPINPETNVDNCGFFKNADLQVSGVDTGLGTLPVVGDPQFVATDTFDFHLRQNSPFIDVGLGTDIIDNSAADIGAYGGQFADLRPFPVVAPDTTDNSGTSPPPYSIMLNWQTNFAYRVTNSVTPGSYRVNYRQNQSGPPYDGTDAGNGSQPSPIDAGNNTTLTLTNMQPSVAAPATPQLLSAEPRSASAIVVWATVSGAVGYRVHYGLASADENQIEVGDVTSLTITGLQNGTEYRFAVSALAQPVYHFSVTVLDNTQNANESDFSPESTLAIGPFTAGTQSNELTATPDDTTPYPDLSDSGCFVATAAFGADWSAEVLVLRAFRDRFLVTNRPGRTFVRWYYRYGPIAAVFIAEHDAVRALVRALLWPFVVLALFMLAASPVLSFGLLFCFLSLIVVRRKVVFQRFLTRPSA